MWLILLFWLSLGMPGHWPSDDDDGTDTDDISTCSWDSFYTAQSADCFDASSDLSDASSFYSLATTATSLGAATYGSKPTSACSGMSKFSHFSEDDVAAYQPTAGDIQRFIIERDGSSSSYEVDRRKPELYAIHVQSSWVSDYQQPQRVTLIRANGEVVLDDLVRTEHYDRNIVQSYRIKNRERLGKEIGIRMRDAKFSEEDREAMTKFILYGTESAGVIKTFVQIYGTPLTRPSERDAPACDVQSFIKTYIGAPSAFVVGFNATADLELIMALQNLNQAPMLQNSAFDINKLYPTEGAREEEYANLENGMKSDFAPDAVENARAALFFMLRKMRESCALASMPSPRHPRGHRTKSHPRDWNPMYQNSNWTLHEDAEYACAFLDGPDQIQKQCYSNRKQSNYLRFQNMLAEEEQRRKTFTLSPVLSDEKKTEPTKVLSRKEQEQSDKRLKEKEQRDKKALEKKIETQRLIDELDRQYRAKKRESWEENRKARATADAQLILAQIYLVAYRRHDLIRS